MMGKKLQGVHVRWQDSASNSPWHDTVDIKPNEFIVDTLGWLIRKDKRYIIVALNYNSRDEIISDSISIPKGCVLSIVYIPNISA